MIDLPKISCVLVHFQNSQTTHNSIECFNNQKYPNKELILVSYDKNLVAQDNSIKKFIVWETINLQKVYDLAIELSSGDLICNWSNTWFSSSKRLYTQYHYTRKHNVAACFYNGFIAYQEKNKKASWQYYENFDYECFQSSCMIKKQILQNIGSDFFIKKNIDDLKKHGELLEIKNHYENIVKTDQFFDIGYKSLTCINTHKNEIDQTFKEAKIKESVSFYAKNLFAFEWNNND